MTEPSSETPDLTGLTQSLAQALIDKKAANVRVLELSELVSYCDRVILCTGNSGRHVRAIADAGIQTAKQQGIIPLGVEGQGVDQWILIDLNDIIIHVFDSSVRSNYDLDSLWVTAPEISLESLGLDLPDADPDSDSDDAPYFVL